MTEIVDFRTGDGLRVEEIVGDSFDAGGRGGADTGEGCREILYDDAAAAGRGWVAGSERFADLAAPAADVDKEGLAW